MTDGVLRALNLNHLPPSPFSRGSTITFYLTALKLALRRRSGYRGTELFGWRRSSGEHLIPLPLRAGLALISEQPARGFGWLGLKILQGQRLPCLAGQLPPVLGCPQRQSFLLLMPSQTFLLFPPVSTASPPATCLYQEEDQALYDLFLVPQSLLLPQLSHSHSPSLPSEAIFMKLVNIFSLMTTGEVSPGTALV